MSHTSLPTLRQSVRVPENCPNVDIILKLVKSLENLIPQQNRLLHMKPRILENVLSILKSLLQRLPNTQINNNPYSHLNVENNNSNFAYSKLIDNIIQMRENSFLESKQNNERSTSTYECQIILQLLIDTVKSVYNQVNAYCVSTGKCDLTNIAPLTNDLITNNDRNLPAHQAIKQIYNTMNLHQHYHHDLQNLQNIAEQELRNFPLDNKLTPNDINHLPEKEELSNLHTLLLQELINSNSRPDEGLSNVNSQNLNDLKLQELLLLNNNIEPNINDNNENSQIQYQNPLNGVQGSNDWTLQELPLLNNNIGPDIHGSNVNPQIQNPDLINNIQGSNSLSIEELLELSKILKPGLNGMNQLQNPNLIGTSSQSNYQTYLQQLLLNALNSHSNEANEAQLSQNQLNNLSLQQLLELDSQLASQNNINSQLYDSSLNENSIKNYNYNRLKELLSIKNSPGANINANILGPLRNRIESSLSLGVNNITENNNIMNSDRLIHSGSQHLLNQPLRSNSYANQLEQLYYLLSKNLNGNGQEVNINKMYDNYPVLDDANNIYSSLNNYIQNNQAGYTHNSYQNQLDAVTAKIDLQKQSSYYNNYLTSKNILGINQGTQDSLYPGISTSPNSYVNPYIINTLVPNNEKRVNYDNQLLVNLPQTPSVSNFDKSNLVQANNKIIELTYALKRNNYNEQPLYYVKYRIPYSKFINDMENLMTQKPYLRNQQNKLYSQLISTSNIIETSKNLIDMNPVDLVKLTHNSGTLMDAKVLEDQIGLSDEQLKLIRDMNAKLSQSNLSSSNASIYKSMNLVDRLIASANPATMVTTDSIVSQTTEATAVPPSGISLNGVDVNSLYNLNSVVNPSLSYILNTLSSPSLNYNSNALSKHNLKYSYNNYGKTISPANNYVLPRPYINPLYRQTVGYVSPYATSVAYQQNRG